MKISVLIMAKNEAQALPRCLAALEDFDEIIVVDSYSTDETAKIARQFGARVEQFVWNGAYPKKTQWALDHLQTKYDWVFLVDADEVVTPDLIEELKHLDMSAAGYFVRGQYVWQGKTLKHGMCNNKLCLFDKTKMHYPVVNDLEVTPDWEMEMHYQPVLREGCAHTHIGQVASPLIHYGCEDMAYWEKRHLFYAQWEAHMIHNKAMPQDPSLVRESLKQIFRNIPLRWLIAFVHSYIFKAGFMDGRAGFSFACARARYYRMVSAALSNASKAPA